MCYKLRHLVIAVSEAEVTARSLLPTCARPWGGLAVHTVIISTELYAVLVPTLSFSGKHYKNDYVMIQR